MVLASVDFATVERLQVQDRWQEAGQLLADAARGLEAAGADLLLLCTNTMHKVADQVQEAVGIPLLHLADATADAVLAAGLHRVGLLGTAFTMEQTFYRERLSGHGLQVLVPPADDRAQVHRRRSQLVEVAAGCCLAADPCLQSAPATQISQTNSSRP